MARAKASIRRSSTALTGWRRALVYAFLAAFTLQSFVVQTHIHFAPDALEHAAAGTTHDGHDRYPPGDDPANCPICQEMLHTGQFITPFAQSLLPPTFAVSTIAIVDSAFHFISAPSHSWRGRAPPHA